VLQSTDQNVSKTEFTQQHAHRLAELVERVAQIEALRHAAARKLWTALAEGELVAILLTADGQERCIDKARWRASDGWNCIWQDRISIEYINDPIDRHFAERSASGYGVALITESRFDRWMNGSSSSPTEVTGTQSTQLHRQPPSKRAVQNWYEARVQNWPEDLEHPSMEDDLKEAKDKFPQNHVTRESIRALRREFAPPTWTSSGRRKSRGNNRAA
jgi:hypothetical protein